MRDQTAECLRADVVVDLAWRNGEKRILQLDRRITCPPVDPDVVEAGAIDAAGEVRVKLFVGWRLAGRERKNAVHALLAKRRRNRRGWTPAAVCTSILGSRLAKETSTADSVAAVMTRVAAAHRSKYCLASGRQALRELGGERWVDEQGVSRVS
jgi:hypothetical protein